LLLTWAIAPLAPHARALWDASGDGYRLGLALNSLFSDLIAHDGGRTAVHRPDALPWNRSALAAARGAIADELAAFAACGGADAPPRMRATEQSIPLFRELDLSGAQDHHHEWRTLWLRLYGVEVRAGAPRRAAARGHRAASRGGARSSCGIAS